MWADLSDVFRNEVSKGEQILWSGQPRQGIMFRMSDIYTIPFSLMWGGFALFWEFTVLKGGAPLVFALWGIPFVLVGLYIIAGRFFVNALTRRETYYALTNQRIIIIVGFVSRSITSVSLATLSEVTLNRINSNGQGTITLGHTRGFSRAFDSLTMFRYPGRSYPPMLEMIDDARAVFDKIKAVQNATSH